MAEKGGDFPHIDVTVTSISGKKTIITDKANCGQMNIDWQHCVSFFLKDRG